MMHALIKVLICMCRNIKVKKLNWNKSNWLKAIFRFRNNLIKKEIFMTYLRTSISVRVLIQNNINYLSMRCRFGIGNGRKNFSAICLFVKVSALFYFIFYNIQKHCSCSLN